MQRVELHPSRLFGREHLFEVLRQRLSLALQGEGRSVFLSGDVGLGKTIALSSFAEEVRLAGVPFLCFENHQRGLSQSLCQRIFQEITLLGSENLRVVAVSSGSAAVFARLSSSFQPVLASVSGLSPESEKLLLFAALRDLLLAYSDGALVLLLDDLQWADPFSLSFLAWLVENNEANSLLLVGAYRPAPKSSILESLRRSPFAMTCELSSLSVSDVTLFIQDLLGVGARELSLFLGSFSGGNPLFINEYLRAAAEGELLSQGEDGDAMLTSSVALPASLLELLEKRLHSLPAIPSLLLESASVLGSEFVVALLKKVVSLPAPVFDVALQELQKRRLLELSSGVLRFLQEELREVVYRGLSVDAKRQLHQSAAEAICSLIPEGERDPYEGVLAWHWSEAGQLQKASDCHLRAAYYSLSLFDLVGAERSFRSFIEALEEPSEESVRVRLVLSEYILEPQGKTEECFHQLTIALRESHGLQLSGLEVSVQHRFAEIYWRTGKPQDAIELFRRVSEDEHRTPMLEARAIGRLGVIAQQQSRNDEALSLLQRARSLFQSIGDRWGEAQIIGDLAVLFNSLSNSSMALVLYEQALGLHQQLQNVLGEINTLGNLATLHQVFGSPEQAMVLYERTLALCRQVGHKRFEATYLSGLASLKQILGCYDEALELYTQALQKQREVGNRRFEGITLGNIATLLQDRGDFQQSQSLYQQALSIAGEIKAKRAQGVWSGFIASLFADLGDLSQAKTWFDSSLQLLREVNDKQSESGILQRLSLYYIDCGDLLAAQKSAELSLQLADESNDERSSAHALVTLAEVSYRKGLLSQAKRGRDAAEATLRRLQYIPALAQLLLTSLFVARALHEPTEEKHRELILLIEKMGLLPESVIVTRLRAFEAL